jgi:Ser/Thr protein kinase RdoA (MazF antagonist)
VGPRDVLERLGFAGARVHRLGESWNAHWLVRTAGGPVVLRRYASDRTIGEIVYELRVLDAVAALGWPVATASVAPVMLGDHVWCVFGYIPGRQPAPRTADGFRAEQRERGRLLARLHADLSTLQAFGQRPNWFRRDEILGEPVEIALRTYAARRPDEAAVLLRSLDQTRRCFGDLCAAAPPAMLIHGDVARWNLRYHRGRLTGVLDWDFTHVDHRAADFAWAWRGRYDEVVHGYEEVSPLPPVERALIAPCYWAWTLDYARMLIERAPDGEPNPTEFDWVMQHIARGSALTAE